MVCYFIRVVRPSQVSLGDILKGESAIHSLEEIGASVQFDFKVHLNVSTKHVELPECIFRVNLINLFFKDNKFRQTPEVFFKRVSERQLAKGDLCREMAPVLDSHQH